MVSTKLHMFKSAHVQNCKCTNMQMCKSASCALLMDSRRGRLGERRRGALLHHCAISVQLQSVANCLQNRFDNLLAHLNLYSCHFLKHIIQWTDTSAPWKKSKGEKIENKVWAKMFTTRGSHLVQNHYAKSSKAGPSGPKRLGKGVQFKLPGVSTTLVFSTALWFAGFSAEEEEDLHQKSCFLGLGRFLGLLWDDDETMMIMIINPKQSRQTYVEWVCILGAIFRSDNDKYGTPLWFHSVE